MPVSTVFHDATKNNLNSIAICHQSAFPHSLSTKLGINFLTKMYSWYLQDSNRFLFFISSNSKCDGFCGGIINDGKTKMGSSSSMLQFTLGEALKGFIFNPFIIFHKDIFSKLPFIFKNFFQKIKHSIAPQNKNFNESITKEPYGGLVVIGVLEGSRGKGLGSKILQEFENRILSLGYKTMQLSVKQTNTPALNIYKKNGWEIKQSMKDLYILHKNL